MSHRLSLIAALVIAVGSSATAFGMDYAKVSFDAAYVTSGPSGGSKLRMLSDGKGHMRTETSTNGQTYVTIMDYPANQATTLMAAQKMAMKVTLKDSPEVHDAASAKKNNAKSLGSKVVNGHPCHGWEYVIPGGKSQVWIGDDINYLVKSETTTAQGKMGMDLKSFAKATPGADQFAVPASYKLMTMPAQ